MGLYVLKASAVECSLTSFVNALDRHSINIQSCFIGTSDGTLLISWLTDTGELTFFSVDAYDRLTVGQVSIKC